MITILGIESSCDDSSLAIVREDRTILFHKTISQSSRHGGVVPEIASRAHLENLDKLLQEASSIFDLADTIDAVAVTARPGLIGGLMTGVIYAKTIASVLRKPIIAVNHLDAHAITIRLVTELAYPFLVLLVSGGNTQFLVARSVDSYAKLGETMDDALGEAFDKVARMLGLGYPGGPGIERRALAGNEHRFRFPKPMASSNSCDFSFSGLKSEVARTVDKLRPLDKLQPLAEQDVNDICASFQKTIADLLEIKIEIALECFGEAGTSPDVVVASYPSPVSLRSSTSPTRGEVMVREKPELSSNHLSPCGRGRPDVARRGGDGAGEEYGASSVSSEGCVAKKSFVLCGGVAANKYICGRLQAYCSSRQVAFAAPPLNLCGDNAAMIAWVGVERYKAGLINDLSFTPCPEAESSRIV